VENWLERNGPRCFTRHQGVWTIQAGWEIALFGNWGAGAAAYAFSILGCFMRAIPKQLDDNSRTEDDMVGKTPEFTNCRVRRFGNTDIFFCLSDNQPNCDYTLKFGDSCFCLSPQRTAIASRTRAA
jgi:hypothetical protein